MAPVRAAQPAPHLLAGQGGGVAQGHQSVGQLNDGGRLALGLELQRDGGADGGARGSTHKLGRLLHALCRVRSSSRAGNSSAGEEGRAFGGMAATF